MKNLLSIAFFLAAATRAVPVDIDRRECAAAAPDTHTNNHAGTVPEKKKHVVYITVVVSAPAASGGSSSGGSGGSGSGGSTTDESATSGSGGSGGSGTGSDTAGSDTAGSDTVGSDTIGSDTIGSDTTGTGSSGSGTGANSTSTTQTSATQANSTNSNTTNSSAGTGTQGVVSTNKGNVAGFPLDGHHLSAPTADVVAPTDNITYTPDKTISGKAFSTWMSGYAKSSNVPASKYIVITPGLYNIDCQDEIVFSFMDGLNEGWTVDFRDVTFLANDKCEAIYINQCEDFTLYGGTIWFDVGGEIWTQSKVTAIDDVDDNHATITAVVEEGYNTSTWREVGPRNLNVIDASNPQHFARNIPDINFQFTGEYNFDQLDSKRTWTMKVETNNVKLKVGYTLTLQTGLGEGGTINSENNGNLHVKGLTTNGGFGQIGLNNKKTATIENMYTVNLPARPGFAPRVEGPTISWGHIKGFNYDTPGQDPVNYVGSKWMTTGCENDLQDTNDQELHDGGY